MSRIIQINVNVIDQRLGQITKLTLTEVRIIRDILQSQIQKLFHYSPCDMKKQNNLSNTRKQINFLDLINYYNILLILAVLVAVTTF